MTETPMTETEWKAAFVTELGKHFRPFDPAKPEDGTEAERAEMARRAHGLSFRKHGQRY